MDLSDEGGAVELVGGNWGGYLCERWQRWDDEGR